MHAAGRVNCSSTSRTLGTLEDMIGLYTENISNIYKHLCKYLYIL